MNTQQIGSRIPTTAYCGHTDSRLENPQASSADSKTSEEGARVGWRAARLARLTRVKRYVEDHIAEHVTLNDAAKIANLEVKYFSRFFRRQTGHRFSAWCRLVRADKALELLKNELLTVSAVAGLVGYADITTFERNFRRVVGVSPRRYRCSLRGDENRLSASLEKIGQR